ncbi:glycoside hydrolase family 3 C-terminal domain-containing protein [Flammeovirga sp. EKP202]|nr:glycoside hydrolase family 3 C-terminal domain-containing protein [Flammeovirga sp. EKP202]
MNMNRQFFIILILNVFTVTSLTFAQQPWSNTSLPMEERVDLLVQAMTLEEKIGQLGNAAPAIERLGLPEYNWWNEALHGVARNGRATIFPQAIGMAATFDKDLIHEVASAIGKEARAKYQISQSIGNRTMYSGLTFWTPNVNIFRDPRWGRGQETYGEDPYLTSQIGIQFVKGLQGNDPKYLQASACAKHYAVHSGPEALRHEFDVSVSKQDLYETYLPAFKALVTEADVESVMGAYNRVYGDPACGSDLLLNEILRKDWGFDGHVVSDCGAIEDFFKYHKTSKGPKEAAALALKMGTNLNCGWVYQAHLKGAIEDGLVDESMVDQRLKELMMTRFKLGFFDPVNMNPFNAVDESVIESEAHQQLSYNTAVKSLVLLKNKNNVLPLNKEIRNLYVVGPNASSTEVLLGNYYGLAANTVSILDGIVGNVSKGTTIEYKQGILLDEPNKNPIDWATGAARSADACIAVMGISPLLEGEEGEAIASTTKGDRIALGLPQNQIDFLKKIKKDSDKPLILVLTGGSPVVLPEMEEIADAILFVWYPGQMGGQAVGDVLFGKVSPSGKLPITFPASLDQLPDYEDYTMKGRTYRYMTEKPLFPFGYGQTYSTFEIESLTASTEKVKANEDVELEVKVKNTGDFDAEDVIQIYLTEYQADFDTPIQSLKKFERVVLKAGETKTLRFTLTPEDRSVFNNEGQLVQSSGTVKVIAADASPGTRSEELGYAKKELVLKIKGGGKVIQ